MAARRADLYRKEGRLREAITLCLEELKARPTYVSARVVLGRAYLGCGDHARAEEAFQRVLELSPDNVRARVHLGQICEAQGRIGDAVGHYEAALEWAPLDRTILADLRRLRGATSSSEPSLSNVGTETAPELPASCPVKTGGGPFATETLADLYASQGLTDQAAAIYQQLLDKEPSREGVLAKLTALRKKQDVSEDTAAALATPARMSREQRMLEELESWLQGIRRYRKTAAAGR